MLLAIGIAPFYVNGYVNSHIAGTNPAYWVFETFCWLVLPLVIFVILVRYAGLRMVDLGLHDKLGGRSALGFLIFVSLLLCPVGHLIYSGSFNYFTSILPHTAIFQYQDVLPPPGPSRTAVAIYFALTAGIVEELYFRGLIFRACAGMRYPIPAYLLISPLLFALIHWETGPANTAAAYVVGLFSAAVFVALRNLWPLMITHAYTDFAWFG